ncbi:right-handed parallel beta-helix repeat-containing protein [Candidatus Sumerlaeota bacterium]|nr:right-handed parallel beta-helix repeat-containing protein [Candidatus Sumerlaeota bacterium]
MKPGGGVGYHSSIQEAIDNAMPEDTIRVAEGYYTETIEIGTSVTLQGGWDPTFIERNWETHVTTIDACRTGSVIRIFAQIYVTIDGFVITGGDATSPLGWGGGIHIGDSFESEGFTIIRNNVITDNIASSTDSGQGHGGGINVYNNTARIENNKINYNFAQKGAGAGAEGGGIHIGWMGNAVIVGNEITSNTAALSPSGGWEGKGGGFYTWSSDVVATDNVFYGNVAAIDGPGKGGGIYAAGSYYRNTISYNTASVNGIGEGGGMYSNYTQYVNDNIIENNISSKSNDGTGGGIYAVQMGECRGNNIRWNTAKRGGGVFLSSGSNTDFIKNTVSYNQATGNVDATMDGGGGISTSANSCQIIDNEISDNSAAYYGGGVQVTGGTEYEINGNRIEGNNAGAGAGISTRAGTGSMKGNAIQNNSASVWGGGMHIIETAIPELDRNIIMGNTATGYFIAGGAMVISVGPTTNLPIRNHIIAQNAAGPGGVCGGIFFSDGILSLENCTIADNNTGSYKEGVYIVSQNGVHNITNCIITGHTSGIALDTGVSCNIDYCDFYDNDVNYNAGTIGTHNLFVDPKFQYAPFGNYRLKSDSQLIDAGMTISGLDHDFEGDPRPHGAGFDIGADESYANIIYVSAISGNDITGNGASGNPYASIIKALNEVQTGGAILVAYGRYIGCYDIIRSVNLQGGYYDGDWTRNISQFVSTLDGNLNGTVVEIKGDDVEALVEGFTIIRGGTSLVDYGSGITIHSGAGAVIRNNAIKDNVNDDSGAGIMISNESGKEIVIDANNIYNNAALGIWNPMAPLPCVAINQGVMGRGGGILIYGAPAAITNNFIHHNQAVHGGDGVFISSYQNTIDFINNSLSDNGDVFGEGLHVFISGQAEATLYNNFFAGHYKGVYIESPENVKQNYNGYFENFVNLQGMDHGANDVFGDPLFCSRSSGDLHIRHGSSVQNKGYSDSTFVPDHDIDGDARPYGVQPDIGADETLGNSPPLFEFIHPSAEKRLAKNSFPITWIDEDIDNNATIQLYYDADASERVGANFIGSTGENDPADMKEWDASGVSEGIYWILAIVSDGINPVLYLYSPHWVKVTKVTPEMLCDHILGRGDIPSDRILYADLNEDGIIDVADLVALQNLP